MNKLNLSFLHTFPTVTLQNSMEYSQPKNLLTATRYRGGGLIAGGNPIARIRSLEGIVRAWVGTARGIYAGGPIVGRFIGLVDTIGVDSTSSVFRSVFGIGADVDVCKSIVASATIKL